MLAGGVLAYFALQSMQQSIPTLLAPSNAAATKVNWSFTTGKARDKLKNRYAELTKITAKN